MSFAVPIYGADNEGLAVFPASIRPLLHAIDRARDSGISHALACFAASFSDPDYACCLSELRKLSSDDRRALAEFFDYAMNIGLTDADRLAVMARLRPVLHAGPLASRMS